MWTIRGREDLDVFLDQRALVSLFVDHAYVRDNIELFLGMKPGFDAHVGEAWHMLIPYVDGGYAVDAPIYPDGFGVRLAREIIKEHDLKHAELPALIFEFVAGREYYCVKFGGMPRERIIKIVGSIADIAIDVHKTGPAEVEPFRVEIHRQVINYLRKEAALTILSKAAPKIGGLLDAAGSVDGLLS